MRNRRTSVSRQQSTQEIGETHAARQVAPPSTEIDATQDYFAVVAR